MWTDLFDRPVKAGRVIAYAHALGRSAGLEYAIVRGYKLGNTNPYASRDLTDETLLTWIVSTKTDHTNYWETDENGNIIYVPRDDPAGHLSSTVPLQKKDGYWDKKIYWKKSSLFFPNRVVVSDRDARWLAERENVGIITRYWNNGTEQITGTINLPEGVE